MATHSSVLAWRIPGPGEPGGLPSMGSHRVRHDWSDLAAAAASLNSACWHFSPVWLFATLWTVACWSPLSMGFFRQEHWSGLLCLPPGNLPNPGIEPASLSFPSLADWLFTISATWEALVNLKESSSLVFSSVQSFTHVWLFATSWTAARQASLSVPGVN